MVDAVPECKLECANEQPAGAMPCRWKGSTRPVRNAALADTQGWREQMCLAAHLPSLLIACSAFTWGGTHVDDGESEMMKRIWLGRQVNLLLARSRRLNS